MITIATTQYQMEILPSWNSYTQKIEALVRQAKSCEAQLLLLPEYAGTEIACARYGSDRELNLAIQPLIPKYLKFYKNLAKHHQLYIQPGTIIEQVSENKFANRAYFFSPQGEVGFQDKIQKTEYEKSTQLLQSGESQYLFQTQLGPMGIAICYDSEFPEIVRRLVEAGAVLILVPSYTSTLSGYYRVLLSCRARAIENQCYVAVAYMVNSVELSSEIEECFGQAAILGPADLGFPDDGIIAQGKMNKVSLVSAKISLKRIYSVREKGQVHNFADFQDYSGVKPHQVQIIKI